MAEVLTGQVSPDYIHFSAYLSRTIGLILWVSTCVARLLENRRSVVGFVPHFLSVRTIGDIANEHVLEHDGARRPVRFKIYFSASFLYLLISIVQYSLGLYAP